jgi:PKHD-type hydroxylase
MPYLLDQPKMPQFPDYVFFENELTPEECEKVISLAGKFPLEAAKVGSSLTPVEDSKIRTSEVSWIPWDAETAWLYDKIGNVVCKTRQSWYPFHLSGIMEPFQLTHYRADNEGHYDTHKDMGPGGLSIRKLSVVVLLSSLDQFEGGELELLAIPGEDKKVTELKQGGAVCFPSWELHRVNKLTKGDRWSLVSWVHGPPFT